MTILFKLNDERQTLIKESESYQIPSVHDFLIIEKIKYQVLSKIFHIESDVVDVIVHQIIEN